MQPDSISSAAPRISYNLDEFIAATGLNRTAIYAALAQGQLRSFKIGRRRMISAEAARDFIASMERSAQGR